METINEIIPVRRNRLTGIKDVFKKNLDGKFFASSPIESKEIVPFDYHYFKGIQALLVLKMQFFRCRMLDAPR
jgi:hypothetical protein